MRVKGRFVKRSAEQLAKQTQEQLLESTPENANTSTTTKNKNFNAAPTCNDILAKTSESTKNDNYIQDEAMPDVNDPEAGFAPTEDQPYRRLRRHTIT